MYYIKNDDFYHNLTDYSCKNGKVNIIVGKGSRKEELVCDKAGQNISVALKDGEFRAMNLLRSAPMMAKNLSLSLLKMAPNDGEI